MSSIKRTCNNCKKMKPLTDFHRNRSKPAGRSYTCKLCVKENREKRERRRAVLDGTNFTPRADKDTKLCKSCGERKKTSQFPRNSKEIDGLGELCKACTHDTKVDADKTRIKNHNEQARRNEEARVTKRRKKVDRLIGIKHPERDDD